MRAYRKLPVVIHAAEVSVETPQEELLQVLEGNIWTGDCINGIKILTLEGTMFAQPGDFIIRGIRGEAYPCKPEIFRATYEEVK